MEPNLDVIGKETPPTERSWNSKDALLYAVGVGAGAIDPVSPDELPYTTENSINVEQRVLPTFGVIIGGAATDFTAIGDIDMTNLVHGEQSIQLHRPIPAEGTVRNVGRITGVFDKGTGMVVTAESTSVLAATGELLVTSVNSLFIRGAGGWGGDRGPSGPKNVPPERMPDHVVTYPTRLDQALTYRLSGDRHALHSDPTFAKMAGFARPILHGLCTFGFSGRALLHSLADGDDSRLTGVAARFARPVFPGDSLTIRIWRTGLGEAVFTTENQDGDIVIAEGSATFTG
jgi:acyl dehydratase